MRRDVDVQLRNLAQVNEITRREAKRGNAVIFAWIAASLLNLACSSDRTGDGANAAGGNADAGVSGAGGAGPQKPPQNDGGDAWHETGDAGEAGFSGTGGTGEAGVAGAGGTEEQHLPQIPCAHSSAPGFGSVGDENPNQGPRSPGHVVAAQGPTQAESRYALITWDRNDSSATGYEVLRDGNVIASLKIEQDAWDDTCYLDMKVTPGVHEYAVRALRGTTPGKRSASYRISILQDADFGSIFEVDSFGGSEDSDRIEAAIEAAQTAGGGVVQFAPRTYTLSRPIVVAGNRIVLRGAGMDDTFLQPSYPGASGDDACASTERIVYFNTKLSDLGNLLAAPIQQGERVVNVTDSSALAVGNILYFSEVQPEQTPADFQNAGIIQDPGTGKDQRYPNESNEIVAIDGLQLTFKYPFSHDFSMNTPLQRFERGLDNRIESLTIQGRSENEQTWYDGLNLKGVNGHAADVRVRWTNRRLVQVQGHGTRLVGFHGPYGGPRGGESGICRYKIHVYRATNALIVGSTMGMPNDDRNLSFITIQQSTRGMVRNSIFLKNQTYGVNEHGKGSRHLLVENNYFSVGTPNRAGVLLGNESWGFSGPMIIRNNTFEDNDRDIHITQNSYEVRMLDNISRRNGRQFLRASGWAGPDTEPEYYGSMRMTIARNKIYEGKSGLSLGGQGGIYPFGGVRDLAIFENVFQVDSDAIVLNGDSNQTKRFQVWDNTGSSSYKRPDWVSGDYWASNADGASYGSRNDQPWMSEQFAWEAFDRY